MTPETLLKLVLHHVPNEDIAHDERRGYWEPPTSPAKMTMQVKTLREAGFMLRQWVEANGLGGGNMARDCGRVTDAAGVEVAVISYNGRAWKPGYECKAGFEILLA